jgi:hypothetical protein
MFGPHFERLRDQKRAQKFDCVLLFIRSFLVYLCPVHLQGKTAAISSSARCLRVSKTESYGLSRICFKMTRQAAMPSLEGVSLSCR